MIAGCGASDSIVSGSFGVSGGGDIERLLIGYLDVRCGRSESPSVVLSELLTESLSSMAMAASASLFVLEAAASASSRSFLRLAASAANLDEPPSRPPL